MITAKGILERLIIADLQLSSQERTQAKTINDTLMDYGSET